MSKTPMSLDQYQEFCTTTAIYPYADINGNRAVVPIYPAMLLASEAGEILSKLQKCVRDKQGNMHSEDIEAIQLECGDVLWAVSALCSDLNIRLQDVIELNKKKLESRKARNTISGSGDNR